MDTESPNSEKRWRLRQDATICGYVREVRPNMHFYSRDGFWWTGQSIDYSDMDEWTGWRDKNNQAVYEWDIVKFRIDPDGADEDGVVLWQKKQATFGIYSLREEIFFPLVLEGVTLFNPREIRVFSYLFLNPKLQQQLGLD